MADGVKFSQFSNGGDLQDGDQIVGLRSGVNTRFTAPVVPTLGQGQLIIGVEGEIPAAGDLISSDDSVNINISVNGEIDLTVTGGGSSSLQGAYDLGNTIQLDPSRPMQVYSVTSSTTFNAVTTPSTGASSTLNYAVHGWTFTTDSDNTWVTAFQYLDIHIGAGESRDLGLYVKSTGQLLMQDNVNKSDPLQGSYRTHTLKYPIHLRSSVEYVIAAVVFPSEIYNLNNDAVTTSHISAIESAVGALSAFNIPVSFPTSFAATPNVTPTAYFQYEIVVPSGKVSFIPGEDGDAACFKAESTSLGTVPVPAMIESAAQGIPAPYTGLWTWNLDYQSPYVYSSEQWKYITPMGRSFPTGSINPITVDNEYICQSASLTTLQMPTSNAYVGSKIRIVAPGNGGFKVQLSTGQHIYINKDSNSGGTSSGGYVTNVIPPPLPNSGAQPNVIVEFVCITENTAWIANTISNLLFA